MRRPITQRAAAAGRGPSRRAPGRVGRAANGSFVLLTAAMVWVQLAYMVIMVTPATAQVAMEPSQLTRLVKFVLLVTALAVVASRSAVAQRVLTQLNRPLLLFIALAVLSVAWSIDRPVTATRLVALASMVMVCVAFGVGSWHPRRFQEVIRPAITVILLASLIVGAMDPTLVREVGNTISLKNAWRGLTSQKNVFGELSSFGVIFWLHGWLAQEVPWYRGVLGVGIAAACLVLSRSSTSLFCTAFAVMFMLILMRSGAGARRYMPYMVVAFAVAALMYCLAVMNVVPGLERMLIDPIVSLTGKNLTFSGRTGIWQIIKENIDRHPYLGAGFGAFWGAGPVPSSPSYEFVERMWGFWPTEAHNGYYDITNDLGFVGLLCLIGYMFEYLRQCLRLIRIDRRQAVLFLALLFQQAILNLTESTWLNLDNFCFTIMTAATLLLSRALVEGAAAPRGERSLALPILRRLRIRVPPAGD